MKIASVVVATVLMVSACGPDTEISVEAAATPEPSPTGEPSPTPESSPEPTAEPSPTPGASPTAAPTSAPPTPEVAGIPEIPVGPPELLGVAIGADAETAIAALTGVLGPGVDSGWGEGCPLDGLPERQVDWGGLSAHFVEIDGAQTFDRWGYRLEFDSLAPIPGGPAPDRLVFPGGVQLGDPYDQVAAAYGFVPTIDEVFLVGFYFGPDFSLATFGDTLDAPIAQVGVPFLGFCE